MTAAQKTKARLSDLKKVALPDILRAAADILEGNERPGFDHHKRDGWVVVIGSVAFPHRKLLAGAIWIGSDKSVDRTRDDFAGNGEQYKPVLTGKYGLQVVDLK